MGFHDAASGYPPFMPDPEMEPALKVVRDARDVAKREIERLQGRIDARHLQVNALQTTQELDVKKLRDFQVEYRAHERLLARLRPGGMFRVQ